MKRAIYFGINYYPDPDIPPDTEPAVDGKSWFKWWYVLTLVGIGVILYFIFRIH